jgi:glycosyltransferase involved in cell wall biosynthesis/Flp pilus assembly protein TadD
MTAAQQRSTSTTSSGLTASGRWLNDKTQALIAAARASDSALFFQIAEQVAAKTLDAGQVFGIASDYAAQRHQWEKAVYFATLQRQASPSDTRKGTHLVRMLQKARSPDLARIVAEQMLRESPDALERSSLLIELSAESGDFERLKNDVASVLNNPASANPAVYETIAQLLINARALDIAGDVLLEAAKLFGPSANLARQRAMLAFRCGDLDDAEKRFQQLADADANVARTAMVMRARIAIERGDSDQAELLFTDILTQEPTNTDAIQYVVRHKIRRGALTEAEAALSHYKNAAGDDATSLWLEAIISVAQRDLVTAFAMGARALMRFPNDPRLALRISDLHADNGDWQTASQLIDKALDKFPEDFALLGRKLRAAEILGSPLEGRLKVTEKALLLNNTDENMLRTKANLLGRMGDRTGAVATAQYALQFHPKQLLLWRISIAGLINLSEREAADAQIESARAVFSADSTADRVALAEILEVGERPEQALGIAKSIVETEPDNEQAHLIAARITTSTGHYRDALPHLSVLQARAVRSGPDVNLRARVASAIRYVDDWPLVDAPQDIFPDAIIARIANNAPIHPWHECNPLIIHVTASMGAGGAERQVALTLRGQAARRATGGMEPILIAGDLNPVTSRDFFMPGVLAAGVETVDLSNERAKGSIRDFVANDPMQRQNIAILSALPPEMGAIALPLYVELVRRQPRVVHLWQDTTAIAGAMAACFAGVPRIVLGTRSTKPVERQRLRPWLSNGYHALLKRPGVVMINNSHNGARDYEGWLDLAAGTITPIYNGYEFEDMRKNVTPKHTLAIKSLINARPSDPVFGGVMRLSFEKRPELWTATAIELSKQIPQLKSVLVGDGPMRDQLQAMIASEGLTDRILLVGRQSPVEPWMSAMTLLFLSSLTEGLPNVLIEAQALGVPVASMRIGGAPETMVEGKTGLLFDQPSPLDLAGKIAPLLLDGALRGQLEDAAKRWTEAQFSASRMLDSLDELYSAGQGQQS